MGGILGDENYPRSFTSLVESTEDIIQDIYEQIKKKHKIKEDEEFIKV